MKQFILFFVFFAFGNTLICQKDSKLHAYLKIKTYDFVEPNYTFDQEYDWSNRSVSAFGILGIAIEKKISTKLSVKPFVEFGFLGQQLWLNNYRYPQETIDGVYQLDTTLYHNIYHRHSIQYFNFGGHLNFYKSDKFKGLSFSAGPSFFILTSTEKATELRDPNLPFIKTKSSIHKDEFSSFVAHLDLGINYSFEFLYLEWIIGLQTNFKLNSFYTDQELKNRYFSRTLILGASYGF